MRMMFTRFLALHLHPHVPAATAAAQAALAGARQLDQRAAPAAPSATRAGRVDDAVVAAEIAGVVKDHGAGQRLDRLDPAALDQLVDDLRVVHDLVGPAELRELVLDGVEAVRAVRDDLAEACTA